MSRALLIAAGLVVAVSLATPLKAREQGGQGGYLKKVVPGAGK